MPDTNAVFLINYARLAASDSEGVTGADAALTAINNLVNAPGINHGVVVDVSTISDMENLYGTWDTNPCDVDAANNTVNAITGYLEEQRLGTPSRPEGSPLLTYVTIVGSDMETFQKIINRDPLNTPTYSNYSYNALAAGNLPVAEQMIGKALEFSPDSVFANFQLARVHLAQNNIPAAEVAIEREPHPVWKNIGMGMIACVRGDKAQGISIADELIEQREIFNAAEIYQLCGDTEKVFELLQQAAADRDPALTEMKLSWAMTPLRSDPRWLEILKVMGLPA